MSEQPDRVDLRLPHGIRLIPINSNAKREDPIPEAGKPIGLTFTDAAGARHKTYLHPMSDSWDVIVIPTLCMSWRIDRGIATYGDLEEACRNTTKREEPGASW